MYAAPPCDPDLDPICLEPSVIDTSGGDGRGTVFGPIAPAPMPPVYQDPRMTPQVLPDLVVNVPAPSPAGVPWGLILAAIGVWAVSRDGGGRSGRSWGD